MCLLFTGVVSEKPMSDGQVNSEQGDQQADKHQLMQVVFHDQVYRAHIRYADRYSDVSDSRRAPSSPRQQWRHESYHILLVTSGEATIVLDGRHHRVGRNTLLMANACQPHDFAPYESKSVGLLQVIFLMEAEDLRLLLPFHELFELYLGSQVPYISMPKALTEQQAVELSRLMELLVGQCEGKHSGIPEISLALVLLFLIEHVFLAPAGSALLEDDSAEKARKLLHDRYRDRISLGELAAAVIVSPKHLCRLFKQRYGVSPIAYQQHLRIESAKALLLSTRLSGKEIAAHVGFSNVYYFYRVFRKAVGVTPGDYRRSQQSILSG